MIYTAYQCLLLSCSLLRTEILIAFSKKKSHEFHCFFLLKTFPGQKYFKFILYIGEVLLHCSGLPWHHTMSPLTHSRSTMGRPCLVTSKLLPGWVDLFAFPSVGALIWPYLLYPDADFPQLCRKLIISESFTFCQIELKLASGLKSYYVEMNIKCNCLCFIFG